MSLLRAVLFGALSFVLFSTLYLLPSGEWLDNQIARPFEFRVRHWLGRDVALDPRIKIYGFGDGTVQALKSFDLSLKEWADVLESFEPHSPRAVFIDKLFDSPRPYADEAEFVRRMKRISFPVIIGAFTHSNPIVGREVLNLSEGQSLLKFKDDDALSWIQRESLFVFGPRKELLPAFSRIGHLDGRRQFFEQVVHQLSDGRLMPHAALWVAEKLEVEDGSLMADWREIPIDRRGDVLNNLPHPSTFYPKTMRLADLVTTLRNGDPITPPPKNAVIALLPGMYTGHGDIQPTPFGAMPGGYLMVSVINSVLTGNWLTVGKLAWPTILLWSVMGVFAGLLTSVSWFWPVLAVSLLGNISMGLISFSYLSWELPWLFSGAAFSLASICLYARKALRQAQRSRKLQQSLEGTFSPEALRVILQSADGLKIEPRGQHVTILFLDIVKFYLAAEKQPAEVVFSHLKDLLGLVTSLVHRHGGVVDKTLGDGMLAYFGYSIDDRPPYVDQAMRALRCAVAIQKEFYERAKNQENPSPPYSVRIGVNTSSVYIGDLGNENRIDITLIGHGVNFAKRLETACDPYRILIGRDMFDVMEEKTIFSPRLMQVKHLSEPIEAYEYDPFPGDPGVEKEMLRYDRFLGMAETLVDKTSFGNPPVARCALGEGAMTKAWAGGFDWVSEKYLCRGVTLEFRLGGAGSGLEMLLNEAGLLPVLAEVESGAPCEGGYSHVMKLVNLTDVQKVMLLSFLLRTPTLRRAG